METNRIKPVLPSVTKTQYDLNRSQPRNQNKKQPRRPKSHDTAEGNTTSIDEFA